MIATRALLASTRVRITVVSVVVVGIAFAAGGLLLDATLRSNAERAVRGSAAPQAAWVESLAEAGPLPEPLPPVDSGRLTLVQVVAGNDGVIASSPQLVGVESDRDDDGDSRHFDDDDRRGGDDDDGHGGERIEGGGRAEPRVRGGPWYVETANATVDQRDVKVVVFTSIADYERSSEDVDAALLVAAPLLLLLVAGATWLLVGRALRPVERMRREVDTITAGRLDSRVAEPASADEVGRLAVTLNSMLERLEVSAERQRRFIADASHELRTPVANVAAALDVARRYPDRADWPQLASDVAEQNERMTRLVNDLLLAARLEHESGQRSVVAVDVPQLVREAVRPFSRGVDVRVVLHEPLPSMSANTDLEALRRVLANLLENAVRHAAQRVEVSVESDDRSVSILVADDGPGIPAHERDRVFEPFVRLDEHRARPDGGAGLGLAIVKDVAAALGATITVTDSSLGGAEFVVTVPRR